MRNLTDAEWEIVSGGTDWGEVGAGVAAVGVSIVIVSNPVGLVGLGAAAAIAYVGGVAIADGMINGNAFSGGHS
jgi:hypothetical protein